MRIVPVILILGLMPVMLVGGSSPGDDSPSLSGGNGTGEFYARVLHRDDLHDVGVYEVEVKVWPATGLWPGVAVENETIKETNIHTLIRVRGLSSPADHLSRARPHVQVEREREYFVDAMAFVWKIVSAHEYLILADPVMVESRPGAYVTEVDAFIEVGGTRVGLADTIIFAGHADRGMGGDHDWGTRHVPERGGEGARRRGSE